MEVMSSSTFIASRRPPSPLRRPQPYSTIGPLSQQPLDVVPQPPPGRHPVEPPVGPPHTSPSTTKEVKRSATLSEGTSPVFLSSWAEPVYEFEYVGAKLVALDDGEEDLPSWHHPTRYAKGQQQQKIVPVTKSRTTQHQQDRPSSSLFLPPPHSQDELYYLEYGHNSSGTMRHDRIDKEEKKIERGVPAPNKGTLLPSTKEDVSMEVSVREVVNSPPPLVINHHHPTPHRNSQHLPDYDRLPLSSPFQPLFTPTPLLRIVPPLLPLQQQPHHQQPSSLEHSRSSSSITATVPTSPARELLQQMRAAYDKQKKHASTTTIPAPPSLSTTMARTHTNSIEPTAARETMQRRNEKGDAIQSGIAANAHRILARCVQHDHQQSGFLTLETILHLMEDFATVKEIYSLRRRAAQTADGEVMYVDLLAESMMDP